MRRLFIFAGFDPRNLAQKTHDNPVITDALILYVRTLSQMGDVVFYMDNNTDTKELAQLAPYTLYAGATAHGEYDFGSYKRGYIWARDNLNLGKYDWVYLVNDSMYAPLYPIRPVMEKLEAKKTDAVGMVCNPHRDHPHIQSWFIGMSGTVFLSDWFDSFITSIQRLPGKGDITRQYEHGFTRLLIENNLTWDCAYTMRKHAVYNDIRHLFLLGFPFMKKVTFSRKHGALARQALYVLDHTSPELRWTILKDAIHVYGKDFVKKFLTKNPVKIMYRGFKHFLNKLFIGGL